MGDYVESDSDNCHIGAHVAEVAQVTLQQHLQEVAA